MAGLAIGVVKRPPCLLSRTQASSPRSRPRSELSDTWVPRRGVGLAGRATRRPMQPSIRGDASALGALQAKPAQTSRSSAKWRAAATSGSASQFSPSITSRHHHTASTAGVRKWCLKRQTHVRPWEHRHATPHAPGCRGDQARPRGCGPDSCQSWQPRPTGSESNT